MSHFSVNTEPVLGSDSKSFSLITPGLSGLWGSKRSFPPHLRPSSVRSQSALRHRASGNRCCRRLGRKGGAAARIASTAEESDYAFSTPCKSTAGFASRRTNRPMKSLLEFFKGSAYARCSIRSASIYGTFRLPRPHRCLFLVSAVSPCSWLTAAPSSFTTSSRRWRQEFSPSRRSQFSCIMSQGVNLLGIHLRPPLDKAHATHGVRGISIYPRCIERS